MSKITRGSSVLKKVARIGFGFLTGCIWLFAAFVFVYTVIVILLPLLSVFAVESLSVSSDQFADILVLAGGCTICLAVLTTLAIWKGLCWMTTAAKRFYHWLCARWNVQPSVDSQEDSMGKNQNGKKLSKRCIAVIALVVVVLIVGVVWYASTHRNSDTNMDDVANAVENVIGGDLSDNEALAPVEPYPTVADANLLDGMNTLNLDDWVQDDFDAALDDMQAVVQQVQSSGSYESSLQIGFDINGDMEAVGRELLTYVGADITANTVSDLVSDLGQSNGVFYDMSFARTEDSGGTVCWRQYNSYAGTSMAAYAPGMEIVYADGYVYLSQVPNEPGKSPNYAYAADKAGDSDIELMDAYQATVVFEMLQPALVNFSVDSDDVAVYSHETEYGTSYLYKMTEQLSRGSYASITKTVLMECVGDGAYDTTIVYALEGSDTDGILAVRISTDVTDVAVSSPDVNEVYFVSE